MTQYASIIFQSGSKCENCKEALVTQIAPNEYPDEVNELLRKIEWLQNYGVLPTD